MKGKKAGGQRKNVGREARSDPVVLLIRLDNGPGSL